MQVLNSSDEVGRKGLDATHEEIGEGVEVILKDVFKRQGLSGLSELLYEAIAE
jgi:hypothetical protein